MKANLSGVVLLGALLVTADLPAASHKSTFVAGQRGGGRQLVLKVRGAS
jgi:hypothetical protein